LSSVLALATIQLSIIGDGTIGSRQSVDTVSNGPVSNIGVLVPDINASVGSGRNGGRRGKIGNTCSRSLSSVLALAAFELGVVDIASVGSRQGVNAHTNRKVEIVVRIPSIGSVGARGRHGRRGRQHAQAFSTLLIGKVRLAACKLGCVSHFIRAGEVGSTVVLGTITNAFGVVQDSEVTLSIPAETCGGAAANGEGDETDLKYFHYPMRMLRMEVLDFVDCKLLPLWKWWVGRVLEGF
jgi:hypothetical protein